MSAELKVTNEELPAADSSPKKIRHLRTAHQAQFKPAGLGKRLAAFSLDNLIIAGASALITSLIFQLLPFAGVYKALVQFLLGGLIIPLSYWICLTDLFGATPGKWLLGLKLLSMETQKQPRLSQIILRETLGRSVALFVFAIGYFRVLFVSDRRGWHDTMAKTIVVEKN